MLKILKRLLTSNIIFFVGLLTLSGCASLEDVDRDKLNHPAMDLKQTQTPSLGTPYTSLNSFREAAAGGGCGSCAK